MNPLLTRTLPLCSHAIVSTSTGPEYYVSVLSIVDKVRFGSNSCLK